MTRTASTEPAYEDDNDDLGDVAWRLAGLTVYVAVGLASTLVLSFGTVRYGYLWAAVLAVGLLAVPAGGVALYRRDRPKETVALAAYATAAACVVVPTAFFFVVDPSIPTGERAVAAVLFGLVGAAVALPVALVGWWLRPSEG